MVAVSNESVIQARRRLRAILAELYSEKRQAIRVVDDAGLLKSNITFSDRAVDNWHYILQEAENQQKLDNLIKVVKLEYSTNLEFHEVCRRYEDVLSQQGAKSSKEVEVSFTNRIDEINAILSTHAAAYYRLNALMGYGKTKLLLELERRFREEQNWLCAYVCVDLNSGLKELTTALVQELGISSWYNSADRSASPSDGALLGNALNRFWQKSGEPGKGIALLIDFDVRPSNREQTKLIESFVRRVWEELIPEVQRPLRSLKNFKENHNRFRVIMASRPVTITYLSYPVSSRNLSPFTFDVI